MKRKVDFDWYCKIKKDVINNAAYELIGCPNGQVSATEEV